MLNAKSPYIRKPTTLAEQLCHLDTLGLSIDDKDAFGNFISQAGYYRVKAYLLPYRNVDRSFVDEACSEKVMQLYRFDSELRALVFRTIQILELVIRAKFNRHMTERSECPFWYVDGQIIGASTEDYRNTVDKITSKLSGSNEKFAKHYRERYFNPKSDVFPDLPPSWMAIELMSFGNITTLMNGLSEQTLKDFKLDRFVKHEFKLNKFQTLTNWMLCIRDVRNHTAHHNRLFNRNLRANNNIKKFMTIDPAFSEENGKRKETLNRIYTSIVAMQVLLDSQGGPKLGPMVADLFTSNPAACEHLSSMGFPSNWRSEKLLFEQPNSPSPSTP